MEKFRLTKDEFIVIMVDENEVDKLAPHQPFSYMVESNIFEEACEVSAVMHLVYDHMYESKLEAFLIDMIPKYSRVDMALIPESEKDYTFLDKNYYVYKVLGRIEAGRLLNLVPQRCLKDGVGLTYDTSENGSEYMTMVVNCLDYGKPFYMGHMMNRDNFKIFTRFFVESLKEIGFKVLTEIEGNGTLIMD